MKELNSNYLIATKQKLFEKAKEDYETYNLELVSKQNALEKLKYLSKQIKKLEQIGTKDSKSNK